MNPALTYGRPPAPGSTSGTPATAHESTPGSTPVPGNPGTAPTGFSSGGGGPVVKRQAVTFNFFAFTEAFHALPPEERRDVGRKLVDLIKKWEAQSDRTGEVIIKTYSLAGIRAEVDFMLWLITHDLDAHQQFSAEFHQADLRRYIRCCVRLLSQTKRSQYVVKLDPEHSEAESRFRIVPGNRKYIFVYPFVKSRDWYLLSKRARQGVMDEHIEVGTKYRSVKLNTTYSFGLDDQDFVVAFETDNPDDFLDLVQELRETESSRYTVRDTPIYTCARLPIEQIIAQFGASL